LFMESTNFTPSFSSSERQLQHTLYVFTIPAQFRALFALHVKPQFYNLAVFFKESCPVNISHE